jgi:ketosteroid isomerase-like protein
MSEENVEVVRRVYEAGTRGDSDAVFALYDPEVVVDGSQSPYADLGIGGVYRGHEGLRSFFRQYFEPWESVEDDYEELIDAGEHVVSVGSSRARGRASGAEVESRPQYGVWTIRDGKVFRVAWFTTREAALEVTGLSE